MTDWQPGDPLYEPSGFTATMPMFELKDGRVGGGGASWPVPRRGHDLDSPLWHSP
jgi:hypothetical protein